MAVMYSKGLIHALCAYSFFRSRHRKIKRFRRSKRPQLAIFSQRKQMVAATRSQIREARACGWRGSFVNEVTKPWSNDLSK